MVMVTWESAIIRRATKKPKTTQQLLYLENSLLSNKL
jgi:hypothetical protein